VSVAAVCVVVERSPQPTARRAARRAIEVRRYVTAGAGLGAA
jgi:hypothetical protein